MSQDIDKIRSPDGAKEAFRLLMDEFFKISNPHPGFRTGSFIGVWSAIQRLPLPLGYAEVFEHWREEAIASLHRLEHNPKGTKFKDAKRDFREKLRGMLDTYLDAQSK
jgi:hypothetical protein